MRAMNWKNLIADLMDSGMTQAEIAEKCLTSQGHVSDLYRGVRVQPGWALGERLRALHRKCRRRMERSSA